MKLNQQQKKYLKKNLRRLTLAQIASNVGLKEEDIKDYLKSIWPKDKFDKLTNENSPSSDINLKTWFKTNIKIVAFLSFLVLLSYANSFGNDFLSDDIFSISGNPRIGDPRFFWKPPYFAITLNWMMNFVVFKLVGLKPFFYRLPNILAHLGSVLMIFTLISWSFPKRIALAVAGVFAVHPLLIEGVAWISGGPYSHSTFFIFLSLILFVLSEKNKKPIWYILFSTLCFYIAILLSFKVFIFPAVLVLYKICFGRKGIPWKNLIPYFLIGGFWLVYLSGTLGSRIEALESKYYQTPGTNNPLLQIPIAASSYLELTLWPKTLAFYHSEMFFSSKQYAIRLAATLCYFGLSIYFFFKDKKIFFWLAFFIIFLSPTLIPFRVGWIVAERYAYPAALGIIFLMVWVIDKLTIGLKNEKIFYALLGILLIAFSARTITRNFDWKNQDHLWLATAKTSPSSPQNHNNLGDYYGRYGNYEKAIEEFQTAIKLLPKYADAHHNMANIYKLQGKDEPALENYLKAISFNPNIWQSHFNVALIYSSRKQYSEALNALEKAVALSPNVPDIHFALAATNYELGNKEKAIEELQNVLKLDPNNSNAKEALLQLTQTDNKK